MINNVSYGHEKKWGKALANLMTAALMSVALIGCGGEGGGGASNDIPPGPDTSDQEIPTAEGFSRICNSGTANAEQSYTIDRLFESLDLDRGYHTCDQAFSSANIRGRIDLSGTGIKDVSVLAGLTAVKDMDLSGNLIENVNRLRNLPSLEFLDLSYNPISKIPDLRPLDSLFQLNLSATAITTLDGIDGLDSLGLLSMGHTAVSDWSPLAQLPQLLAILLPSLDQPESLATLPADGYIALNISGNGVKDLAPFAAKFPALQFLIASENQLTSLQPLADLDQLRLLDVRDNKIDSIAPGVLPPFMRLLSLASNPIRDFAFTEQLQEVAILDFSSTGLSSIKPILPLMDKAEGVYLQDTPLSTLDIGLSVMVWSNLKELDLSNTPLTSLSPMTQVIARKLGDFAAYGTPAMASKDAAACPTQDAPDAVQFFCSNGYSEYGFTGRSDDMQELLNALRSR